MSSIISNWTRILVGTREFPELVVEVLAEKADLPSMEVLRRAWEGGYTGARERFTV